MVSSITIVLGYHSLLIMISDWYYQQWFIKMIIMIGDKKYHYYKNKLINTGYKGMVRENK